MPSASTKRSTGAGASCRIGRAPRDDRGAERNLRERPVERADEQGVAPDGHGPGEQAGTERADVVAAFELGDAERRADVGAVAVRGDRQDARDRAARWLSSKRSTPPARQCQTPWSSVPIHTSASAPASAVTATLASSGCAGVSRRPSNTSNPDVPVPSSSRPDAESEQGGQLPLFRPIGPHVKHATAIEGQQTVRRGRNQQLGFRRGREHADGEADEPRWRELEAGLKAPHDRAVRVVFDETLRPGDEQMAVEQRGVAKDRLRADRFDVSR